MRRRQSDDHAVVDVAWRMGVAGHDVALRVHVARPQQRDHAPVGRLCARRPDLGRQPVVPICPMWLPKSSAPPVSTMHKTHV